MFLPVNVAWLLKEIPRKTSQPEDCSTIAKFTSLPFFDGIAPSMKILGHTPKQVFLCI